MLLFEQNHRARSFVLKTLSAVIVLLGTGAANAAAAQPAATPASQIGKPIMPIAKLSSKKAVVRTLGQALAFQAAHPGLGLPRAAHRPLIPIGTAAYQAAKQKAAAGSAIKPTAAHTPAPPPSAMMKLNVTGPVASDPGNSFYPPDSNGAIGGNYIVAPVNSTYNVYDRNGVALLNTTFNALLGTADQLSDPRVIYDPVWKRWVFSIISVNAATDPASFWLVISQGKDPRGPFFIYHVGIPWGAGDLWDYDMLGMTQDAVMLTGNHFLCCYSFAGAVVVSIPKAMLYNGYGWSSPLFGTPTSSGTLTPPIVQDSNATAYLLAADNGGAALNVYAGTNLSNQGQFSFALQAQIPVTWAVPPSASQHTTALQLDTLDGRFVAPSAQYGNKLWNVHTIALGAYPAPKFYEIDTGANTLIQSGFFFESATSDDFNASIAANNADEAFVTWSATDPTLPHQAKVMFTGRQAGDSLGSMQQPAKRLITSTSALTGNTQNGVERWGDYSSVFLDSTPHGVCNANRRAAIFNEYIVDANTWGVQMGIVGFC
jgi:hypothetical protein